MNIDQIEKAVAEMPVNNLLCRDLGHAWSAYSAERVGKAFVSSLRCIRCKTIKERMITGEGFLNGTKFKYTDGYLIKGIGRATIGVRSIMRLESVMRVVK